MCYSKEVQLLTSILIFTFCIYYYFTYTKLYKETKKEWLLPFLNTVLLVFMFIGLHQFFEFLSLITEKQIIYKIGLIFSIISMYFILRSFEILTKKKIHSILALLGIGLLAVYIFSRELSFAPTSFYISHNGTYFWAAVWLILFTYWHFCVYDAYKQAKEKEKRILFLYLVALIDISFLLSTLYVLFAYVFFSLNVCTDAPSIWCTFFVVQALCLPFLLHRIPSLMKKKRSTSLSTRKTMFYFILSVGIVLFLTTTLFFMRCLTWKFVFP